LVALSAAPEAGDIPAIQALETTRRYFGGDNRVRLIVRVDKDQLTTTFDKLSALKSVVGYELNQKQRAQQTTQPTPNDDLFPSQDYLHNPGGFGHPCADTDLNAPEAWQALGRPGVSLHTYPVTIGLVDTGVSSDEEDLKDRISSHRKNFSGGANDEDVADSQGHGTNLAGIIAAEGDNDHGVTGEMWGTTIVPCKFSKSGQDGTVSDAVRCFDWIGGLPSELNVVAVNYSFGDYACSCEMEAAIRRLRDRGIVFVTAAGNSGGGDNDGDCPWYPASLPLSNIISVAATDRCGNLNTAGGAHSVHAAAPADGMATLVGGLGNMQGSSPAAAEVSGLIALLKAQEIKPAADGSPLPKRDWRALRNLVIAGGKPASQLGDHTVSQRRIRAFDIAGIGSMTCSGQKVSRRVWPHAGKVVPGADGTVQMRILSIDCADTTGPVTAKAGAETIEFHDDGVAPDDVPGDGEWGAKWKPPGTGSFTVTFDSGAQDDLVVEVP
jgi:hypothetical protein